jgi:hypothetical protein
MATDELVTSGGTLPAQWPERVGARATQW